MCRANRRDSEAQIMEAVANGADAILITVDVAAMGKREADRKVESGGKAVKKDGGIASQSFSLYDREYPFFPLFFRLAPRN